MEIQYKGLEDADFDELTKSHIQKIVLFHANKLKFHTKNDFSLIIHVKSYKETGKQRKYSIHLQLSYPAGTVVSDKVHDWDIYTAIHKSFAALETEIKHKFKKRVRETSSLRKVYK